uniref:Uncharacterized protein n=1 Tax=Anguilla anguilla TaxID=7936 RepID=A0A0E9SNP0_ANGAN
MSGFSIRMGLCAEISAFPETSATLTSLAQKAVNWRAMAWTCWPNSLVGTRISALTACSRTVCLEVRMRWMIGTA